MRPLYVMNFEPARNRLLVISGPAAREARAFPMAERDKSVMNLQSTGRDA
jgi:hypothetical protein